MSSPTLAALCESIWRAEQDLGLLAWELDGVKAWQAARMRIYYALARCAGVLENTQLASEPGTLARLATGASLLRGSLSHNPFRRRGTADVVVFEHPRPRSVDGETVDIYTQSLVSELEAGDRSFALLDRSYGGTHAKTPNAARSYLDVFDLRAQIEQRFRPDPLRRPEDATRVRQLEQRFGDELGARVSLGSILASTAKRFPTHRKLYRALLSSWAPQEIYCVCSYDDLAPMISVAHELQIPVIELQHGTYSRYHLGYSFPDRASWGELDYFPDRFLTWSEQWTNLLALPTASGGTQTSGFPYFDSRRERYRDVPSRADQIVVLSQGAIGSRLADEILRQIDSLQGYEIVYKLHPAEYARWRDYPSLVELERRKNVEVVTEVDLYQLFAESSIQIGVFSTALHEGLEFGLETVLVDLPGIEYMQDLLARGQATRFRDFIARTDSSPLASSESDSPLGLVDLAAGS